MVYLDGRHRGVEQCFCSGDLTYLCNTGDPCKPHNRAHRGADAYLVDITKCDEHLGSLVLDEPRVECGIVGRENNVTFHHIVEPEGFELFLKYILYTVPVAVAGIATAVLVRGVEGVGSSPVIPVKGSGRIDHSLLIHQRAGKAGNPI